MECTRCGVIVDKFARRTHGGGQGTPQEQLRRLAPTASKDRQKRPLGRTLAWGFVLIVTAIGLGVLFDYMRLHLQGNRVLKVLRAAGVPRQYGNQLMTAEQVLQRISMAAREENIDVPPDRTYIKMHVESGELGAFIALTMKVQIPAKITGVIKYPIYREVTERIPLRMLKVGYAQFETDPNSEIARDIEAATEKKPVFK